MQRGIKKEKKRNTPSNRMMAKRKGPRKKKIRITWGVLLPVTR
jgi:hypothetical protein